MGKKVLVIGAGIVGCSAALWLQRDGHQVTIVDKTGPGEGASKGNASVIAIESCIPVATPGILWDVPKYLSDPLGPLTDRLCGRPLHLLGVHRTLLSPGPS